MIDLVQRPEASRGQRKSILIATEDLKSSRIYFEALAKKLHNHRVIVIAPHQGSAPKNVVQAAKQSRHENQQNEDGSLDVYDEVWVVFDTEGPQNPQRQQDARNAIQQAKDLNMKTAISNPAFEFWLLLHFDYHTQPIQDDKAARKLLKNFVPEYTKGKLNYDRFHEFIGIAIKNSKKIFRERHSNSSNHICDCHPATEIHKLIECLLSEE